MGAVLDAGGNGLDGGFGGALFTALQALAALALLGGLVWLVRRTLLATRFGARADQQIRVEERMALDLRNALVIVRVEDRRLLLALGDQGPPRLIAELSSGREAAQERA